MSRPHRSTSPAAEHLVVEARAGLTGDVVSVVEAHPTDTTRNLSTMLCRASDRSPDEWALLYRGERIDLNNRSLRDASIVSPAAMQLVRVPPVIRSAKEMMKVFTRHLPHRNRSTPPEQVPDPAILSFLTKDFFHMDGEYVARLNGDGEGAPRHTRTLFFYPPDGARYCYAYVSTRPSSSAHWLLDNRPVFLKILSFGTCEGSTVNPRNGHMTTCSCQNCSEEVAANANE